jgi:hypothetical protein
MAVGSTQPVSEMGTRNLPGGKKGGRRMRLRTSTLCLENVGAPTSHNAMGLHGLLTGIALPYCTDVRQVERSQCLGQCVTFFCGANNIRALTSSIINTFNLGYVYAGASMLTMNWLTNVNMNGGEK